MIFKESFRQLLAVSLVGLLTRAVVLVAVASKAGGVTSRANTVGVNTRISLVGEPGVVGTCGVAAVDGAVTCGSTVRASNTGAGRAVGV